MGIRSEWKHNKKGLAIKVGVAAAISGALYLALRKRDDEDDEEMNEPERRPPGVQMKIGRDNER
jgi:hypothetical protein